MVIITTTLGATNRYKDQQVMRKTFDMFLRSLDNQINKNFKLFIACHDIPEGFDHDYIEWRSLIVDKECKQTKLWKRLPVDLTDQGEMVIGNYDLSITDMSRKSYHGTIEAGRWAGRQELKTFWMLRMDSDDLLANDVVDFLEKQLDSNLEAMFNRNCHMFDIQTGKFAEHYYPYSTTCNALKMRINDSVISNWYYHCRDHTLFMADIKKDRLNGIERDWNLCITTNSGNSISDRPAVEKEKNVRIIKLSESLANRYGLLI